MITKQTHASYVYVYIHTYKPKPGYSRTHSNLLQKGSAALKTQEKKKRITNKIKTHT
jgi:hypothetical protein